MLIRLQQRRLFWLDHVHHVYPARTTQIVLAKPCPSCLSGSNNADCSGWTMSIRPQQHRRKITMIIRKMSLLANKLSFVTLLKKNKNLGNY
ncbi:hypothetical protein PoB_006521000 [Plakobranchus ocellatus]|uniref:Uncharacterized protein n=1 Tax=Plakobranchus ocellatus TaxID=259542 RepID=A0AAV4D3M8_9GAST|nr:hypothetical protein PoB_006521000 [Plakobranchus ocellatus]